MRFRFHLTNPAIFAMMWIALSALVLHDIALRRATIVSGASGTAISEKVVTKEFVLVDDNGRTRARIGMIDKTGAPSVQLFDSAGQQRAQLRLNQNDVPSLRLYDGGGMLKSVMGFTLNDMQPSYVTFDATGNGHVENTNRPFGFYGNIHDEDLMNQNVLSFGAPSPAPYQIEVRATDTSDLYLTQQVDAAKAQARQAFSAQIRAQAAEDAARISARAEADAQRVQIQSAESEFNTEAHDPFRPNNR